MKTVIGSGNFPIVIKDEGDLAAHVEAGATSVSVAMPAENNPSAIEEEAPLSSSSESTSGSEMEETTYEPHAGSSNHLSHLMVLACGSIGRVEFCI